MKEFQITWEGVKVPLKVNDKPNAGFCLKVSKPPIMTYKAGQPLPEINDEEYLMLLATNLIIEAPWTLKSPDAIRNLPKDTFFELCGILGDEFPVGDFLYPVAKLRYGKLLETTLQPSQTESITKDGSSDSTSSK